MVTCRQSVKDRVEDFARVGIDVRGWARQQDTARVSAYVDLMGKTYGAVGTSVVMLLLAGCSSAPPPFTTHGTNT
jgi:hypothetical protein